jgi:hypothetical protein
MTAAAVEPTTLVKTTMGLGILLESSKSKSNKKTVAMVTSREIMTTGTDDNDKEFNANNNNGLVVPTEANIRSVSPAQPVGPPPPPPSDTADSQMRDWNTTSPMNDDERKSWTSSGDYETQAPTRKQAPRSWGQSSTETFHTTASGRQISSKGSSLNDHTPTLSDTTSTSDLGSSTNLGSSNGGHELSENDTGSSFKENRTSNTSIEQWRGEAVGMIATPFAAKHHPQYSRTKNGSMSSNEQTLGAPGNTIKCVSSHDAASLEAFENDISRRLKADDKSSDLTLTFERDSDGSTVQGNGPDGWYDNANSSLDAITPQLSQTSLVTTPTHQAPLLSSALSITTVPGSVVSPGTSTIVETASLRSTSPQREAHHHRRLSRIGSDIDKRVRRGKEVLRRQTSVATSRMSTFSIYGLNPSIPSQVMPLSSELTRTPSIRTYENFLRAKDLDTSKFVSIPSSTENVALWFLKQIILSKTNGQGAFVSDRLYIPCDLWNTTTIQYSLLQPRVRCLDTLSKLALDIIQETQDGSLSRTLQSLEQDFHVAFVYPLNWDGAPTQRPPSPTNQPQQPPPPPPSQQQQQQPHSTTSRLNGVFGRFRRKTITPETAEEPPERALPVEKCRLDQYLSSIASLAASLESMDQYVETIAGLNPQPRQRIGYAEEYRRFASKTACSLLLKDVVILQSIYKEEFYEFLINVN